MTAANHYEINQLTATGQTAPEPLSPLAAMEAVRAEGRELEGGHDA